MGGLARHPPDSVRRCTRRVRSAILCPGLDFFTRFDVLFDFAGVCLGVACADGSADEHVGACTRLHQ